jgi:hypothetical protein
VIHRHIDVGSVLRGAVCELYSNLVTRPTGAAVRSEIERAVAEAGGPTVTVIDFSQVTLLDFSCADEIVAKLMLRHVVDAADAIAGTREGAGGPEGYFVFRGICERHLDAIEAVLERHGLAIVALADGAAATTDRVAVEAMPQLVGEVAAEERLLWERLCAIGPADAHALSIDGGISAEDAAAVLARLVRRRLAMPVEGGGYLAVGLRVPPAPGAPSTREQVA